jgi:hypothetical protein
MTSRPIEELHATRARGIAFVLVNERAPRTHANCALCCARIERGYVRDPQTRLVYCDAQCFSEHEKTAFPAVMDHGRRVS